MNWYQSVNALNGWGIVFAVLAYAMFAASLIWTDHARQLVWTASALFVLAAIHFAPSLVHAWSRYFA